MKYAYKNIVLIAIIVFSIIFFNILTKNRSFEGFTQNTSIKERWSQDLINRFLEFQKTVYDNNYQFDMEMIQKQATPQEAEYLLKHNKWPWSDELKYLYMEHVWKNPMIKINPGVSLEQAMKVYNQNVMKQLLAWNTKEGELILYGADLGLTPGMQSDIKNTIKCTYNKDKNEFLMQKTVYNGYNTWNGHKNMVQTYIQNDNIPKEIPGFKFVREPCNPCSPLNNSICGKERCPFMLNVKGDDNISQIWKEIWGLN